MLRNTTAVSFRLSSAEREELKVLAQSHFGGNVSSAIKKGITLITEQLKKGDIDDKN